MKKNKWNKLVSVLLAMVTAVSLLSGCGGKSAEKEDAETITVYLWSTKLYEKYAPYIQEQLPDINVEFVVGNNDLDFYRFLNENGGLPDIITCCRFSLHDASPLKDSLMDLSTTNAAGAVYDTYLSNFMNEDGSVNWLPVCADAHGFVVNKDLFEKYDIPLPTDYESFVSACQTFDKVGIRGFTADYYYDYTCMETLQGLSASELSSVDGRKWRTTYSAPDNTKREGLDSTVWPEAFERMEQFIQDTGLSQDDLDMNYDDVVEMYKSGKLAMYFGSSAGVKMFQDQGINTTFLPFFQQNGEKWLMTTPYFQIALNRDLTKDETRRQKAMKVLNTMLSEDAQNRIIYDGQDLLSYSQDVDFRLTEYLKDGENKLAAQVFKWTASSWCEDQDFFRFSGIYRDVYLYTVPEVHAYDVKVRALPDAALTAAELSLTLQMWGSGKVKVVLKKDGQTVLEDESAVTEGEQILTWNVERPVLWSAEDPQLYDLTVEVCDGAGT